MMEEELKKIWQSTPNRERVRFEKARLMVELRASLDRIHGMITFGNSRATITPWVIVLTFSLYIYFVPFILSKIASGLAILFAIHVLMKLQKSNKKKPMDFAGTYLEYLHKTKVFLLGQKQLTDTSLYWAIIPGISVCILFFLGFMESPLFTKTGIIVLCVGCLVIGVIFSFLIKWWVAMAITPNLQKIDELISTLEESESQRK